jgi:ferredoxin-NADP reductase
LQIVYAILVGILASPFAVFKDFYFTPELALVAGNVFSFLVSPKFRVVMTLKEKRQIGQDLYEFIFAPNRKFDFRPGQYFEWTLGHKKSDLRGNRRYFTIASSPTEDTVRLGIKFYPQASSFKKALSELGLGSKLFAGQLAGEFILPSDTNQKLIFIAGGIGITPYRSMLRYLLDKKEKRPITFFFSNKSSDEIVYKNILDEANSRLGIRTIYTLTDKDKLPAGWSGEVGRISEEMIARFAPDYKSSIFYISGTHQMVTSMETLIKSMGIPGRQIKKDYFPGFA